jgi:hypothetical protein
MNQTEKRGIAVERYSDHRGITFGSSSSITPNCCLGKGKSL